MRLHGLLDTLVARRRDLGLTQKQVADRMGVRQPAVSGFETESSDPKISTVQRYARAVNAYVRFAVEPAHPGQSFRTSETNYVPTQAPPVSGAHATFEATPAEWRDFSRDARTPAKNEYALAS
jgi:transcriptional regulator with XRE-family HTH domain